MVDNKELWENHKNFIHQVISEKYIKGEEKTWEDVKQRIINNLPYNIKESVDIKEAILDERIVPAGSILSEFGIKESKNSYSNCYALQIPNDSIEGIYLANSKMARIFSLRGGCGTDGTIMRPKNTPVNNAAKTSSGAVSFMNLFATTTETICQGGRRAAMLISLDIRHPDAIDFIKMKYKPHEVFGTDSFSSNRTYASLSSMNISLRIPDTFWLAVEQDKNWDFIFPDIEGDKDLYNSTWDGIYENWTGKFIIYKTVPAREIFSLIAEAAHACGDPGILCSDTIRNTPASTISNDNIPMLCNPCSEVPIPNNGNCLLTTLVLHKYVEDGKFDFELFKKDVITAVWFLNIISSYNRERHPFQDQQDVDNNGRRIGLEITALGDCLARMNLIYGSEESLTFIEQMMCIKAFYEIYASSRCAEYFGVAPLLKNDNVFIDFIDSDYISRVFNTVRKYEDFNVVIDIISYIRQHRVSNISWAAMGPCGTISLAVGNVSSGIEPVYALEYKRRTRLGGEFDIVHGPLLEESIRTNIPIKELASKYVMAKDLHWKDKIKVQAVIQKYTDGGVSSTINLPSSTTVEEVEEIYLTAWKSGLKGITIFRDGCKSGVLSTKKIDQVKELTKEVNFIPWGTKLQLLNVEDAKRHKIVWKKYNLYVLVSLDDNQLPIEVFTKIPRSAYVTKKDGAEIFDQEAYNEDFSNWESLCRTISRSLRYGAPIEEIVEDLNDSSFSMFSAAGILQRVLSNYLPQEVELQEDGSEEELGMQCPECGHNTVFKEGGCKCCKNCTYSSCA